MYACIRKIIIKYFYNKCYLKVTVHWYQSCSTVSTYYRITVTFIIHIKYLSKSKEFRSQGNFSTQYSNSHKCLPVIDRANKPIHGQCNFQ